MRKTLFILSPFFLFLIFITPLRADIHNADSGSYSDIQTAINASSNGDTVFIPAGTHDFGEGVVNFNDKVIHIKGAGRDLTIIEKTSASTSYKIMFTIGMTGNDGITCSDMTLKDADGVGDNATVGLYLKYGHWNFKVYNMQFENFGYAGIHADEHVFGNPFEWKQKGVIYECRFINNFMPGLGYGVVVSGNDDYSWNEPLSLGTAYAVFVEDCYLEGQRHHIASGNGSRYVFRYNSCKRNKDSHGVDVHGWNGSGSERGSRSYEIYENTIEDPWHVAHNDEGIRIRGGDGVIYNNTIKDMDYGLVLIVDGCEYTCAYPRQDQERDLYIWGNTYENCDTNFIVYPGFTHLLQENRDYFLEEKSGYTPYTYPHPLRTDYNPLNANINASPTLGWIPLTVNFTGSASGGVPPYTYSWDFGDGTSSSEQNPTHTYSNADDYTVTLIVTDSESSQDNDSLIINAIVATTPLAASFIASPTSGEVPLTVNFSGNATGGVLPYSYSWDFGDGTSSSEQNPTHTYSQADDYTVTLTVTDSESSQDNDSLIINVSAVITPLIASFIASPTSGEVPLTVNFTGSATGGVLPYSYSWDFGDGTSSSEQNPTHTYSNADDYTVTLTVTDSESNQDSDSLIINANAAIPPYLSCSPTSLYFGATTSGYETTDQYLRIINAGGGALTWNIEDDADWLSCSPSSGTDRGEITVSVNASGLPLGLYVATITVSSPEAYNSPQYVSVNLRVYEPEQESPPFGSLDTPVDGSTVSGSIPITGWVLDDIEVVRLEIKRNSDPGDPREAIGQDGLIYIGDAIFVEGARPDVQNNYADYPLNSRAGWGYMLLTNDLPYRGNGSFTIYGFAYDASGHREEIGRKTILCDNINRVKPFGTIDTPAQGESIGGSDYINFGWALIPLPKTIHKNGSTIWVWVDGVQVGHPVYDQYREDIATLYPEYNNAQGAVGYYYLDTTQYENGMHTIVWSVTDDEGEVDEIGARYFFIDNIETGSTYHGSLGLRSIYRERAEGRLIIRIKEVRKEYRPQADDDQEIATKSILNIQIEEMEPLRIALEESPGGNMRYIGWGEDKWKALPIGSTLDREKGIFSWIPTPGFIGRYVLHFAVIDGSYMSEPLRVEVNVIPKKDRNKENLQATAVGIKNNINCPSPCPGLNRLILLFRFFRLRAVVN